MAPQGIGISTTQVSSASIPVMSSSAFPIEADDTTANLSGPSQKLGTHYMSTPAPSVSTSQHYSQSQYQPFSQSFSVGTLTGQPDARRANILWKSRVDLITRALEAWSPENHTGIPTFATDVTPAAGRASADGTVHAKTKPEMVMTMAETESQKLDQKRLGCTPTTATAATNAAASSVHDEDQQAAIDAALNGESFFLTGSAGTGKSYVLKQIIRKLREKRLTVAVTASTGCAAVAIQGCTIHSAAGVGLGLDSIESLKKKARMPHIQSRLIRPDVLIIDEVSMLDAILFDKVEAMYTTGRTYFSALTLRKKRALGNENMPFGGLQVIVCGDFFQLPPVAASDPKLQYSQSKMFAFESNAWRRTIQKTFLLRRVHRQADRNFIGLLNELRHGVVSRRTMRVLSACRVAGAVAEVDDEGLPICYTKLYAFRRQVEQENERRLAELPGLSVAYRSNDRIERDDLGILPEKAVQGLLENVNANTRLVLRKGARVLCTKNVNQPCGVVNGSAGTVIGFTIPKEDLMKRRLLLMAERLPTARKNEAIKEIENSQPEKSFLTLLEKVSAPSHHGQYGKVGARGGVEKSGEIVKSDVSKVAENTSPFLKNVYGKEPMTIDGLMEDEVVDLDHESLRKFRENEKYIGSDGIMELDCRCGDVIPVVRFDNGVIATMYEESWSIIGMRGQEVAERRQIPLALGWAMTIHKSQGMTLDKVETDVGKAFDFGQVYVALSRAVSMQGLRITTFNASKVMAHQKVKEFYAGACSSSQKSKRPCLSETASEEDKRVQSQPARNVPYSYDPSY